MVLISDGRLDELLSSQLKIYLYLGRIKPMSHDGFMANYRIELDPPFWMKITREFEFFFSLSLFLRNNNGFSQRNCISIYCDDESRTREWILLILNVYVFFC